MPDITLQQLRYAIEVANADSIVQAAKALYISQPGLSNAIKELEEELEIKLFQRSRHGVTVTEIGAEFIREAEQILAQVYLLETKYSGELESKQRFSVSTQHYTFASAAFSELANKYRGKKYEFRLMETKTREVLNDVRNMVSEIGIIYMSEDNETYIKQILREDDLKFSELFTTHPYILVGQDNPLSKMECVCLQDLESYPCITFGQENLAPLYLSEEILNNCQHSESLIISDRGALADLLCSTDAYLISSGIYMTSSKSDTIIAVPLLTNKTIRIGIVRRKDTIESPVYNTFRTLLIKKLGEHFESEYTL
jgi:DNA-binding transcriptional LysR family regulator